MTSTHARPHATGASIGAMARIEARRLARNPFFILATLVALGVQRRLRGHRARRRLPGRPAGLARHLRVLRRAHQPRPAVPADAEHRGRRRGDVAAPGSEADRTLALCLAAFVPAAAGWWSWRRS